MGEGLGRVARTVTDHPIVTVAVVVALALVGAGLALRLDPSASTDTLVGRDTEAFRATERFRDRFGDDAVIVLVRGDLQKTVLTSDLGRLIGLEGCLSGNVPEASLAQLPPQCRQLARDKPARVVYGPGTFINVAVGELQDGFQRKQAEAAAQGKAAGDAAVRIARQKGLGKRDQQRLRESAERLANQQFVADSVKLASRYGLFSVPSIDNPEFVSQLVFDTRRGPGVPKARFAYLFPSPNAALIQVRLKPHLTDAQRSRAIDAIEGATKEKRFALQRGGRYVVTGVPVVVDGLSSSLERSIFVLLGAALLVMAATLALVFRTRMRLLPLGVAVAAGALTYGCVSLAGYDLTMASIAALPVLIGLAVDYAIQLQARFDEARREDGDPERAARAVAVRGGPLIAGAATATAAGFLVLLLSPVPMIHGFAVAVILGIVLALGCALTAGLATLARWSDRTSAAPPALPRLRRTAQRAGDAIAWSRPGRAAADAGGGVAHGARRAGRRALDFAISHPRNVLVAGLAVAALGWAADAQTDFVSDVRKLVPQDLPALRDINALEKETGVSGEIDVMFQGTDLTQPHVIAWMTAFQKRLLEAHGWQPGDTCRQTSRPPELCPALSLTDLFRAPPDSKQSVEALLSAVPNYFSQAVITSDRRTANLAFGIRLMPLDRQQDVIEDIRAELRPPPGVSAHVVGLPVLAAESNGKLAEEWRRALLLLAGLAAVFLVLLAIRRRPAAAAVPLIPIAFATGWSALVLFLIGIPLNPMSATLGALVIAISTEFSVLLSARYREERDAGASPARALELTYASTGAAVLASGATAIAGFAALAASDIRMLRDFGVVTVVDLTVSLLGVMVVLPAALVWAEEAGPLRLRSLDPRRPVRVAFDTLAEGLADARAGMPPLRLPRAPSLRPRRPRVRALRPGAPRLRGGRLGRRRSRA